MVASSDTFVSRFVIWLQMHENLARLDDVVIGSSRAALSFLLAGKSATTSLTRTKISGRAIGRQCKSDLSVNVKD